MVLTRLKDLEDQARDLKEADVNRSMEYRVLLGYLESELDQRTPAELNPPIECTTLYKQMVLKNKSRDYDPFRLDDYSLDWKSIDVPEPSFTYRSAASQLSALCKRTPARSSK